MLRQHFSTASTKSLCEIFPGRPYNGIRHVARRMGLEKAAIYHVNRRYPPNPTFWKEWSPELAYVLGLILTDGSIRNQKDASVKIRLRLRDREVLQQIAELAGGYFHESEREATWACSGRDVVEWIAEKGIRENKMFRATVPPCPPELRSHLLRGLYDGDGSFGLYKSEASAKHRRVKMAGQPELLRGMVDLLLDENILDGSLRVYADTRCQCSSITITKTDAVRRMVDWLYKDATIYIEAKREQAMKAAS